MKPTLALLLLVAAASVACETASPLSRQALASLVPVQQHELSAPVRRPAVGLPVDKDIENGKLNVYCLTEYLLDDEERRLPAAYITDLNLLSLELNLAEDAKRVIRPLKLRTEKATCLEFATMVCNGFLEKKRKDEWKTWCFGQ